MNSWWAWSERFYWDKPRLVAKNIISTSLYMNNLLIMVLYPYWWAISCMFQNHWVNSLFTEMTIWGPWCPRRVSQTGIIAYPCLRYVLLAREFLYVYQYINTRVFWCCSWRLSLTTCGTVKVKRPSLFIHLYICIWIIFQHLHVLPLLTSYNPYAPKSVRQCVGYYNGFIGTLVSEAGDSNRDDTLSRHAWDANITRGDFTQSYLRNHLIKWFQACPILYQLYIGYRYHLYTLFIFICYIYIHHIYFYTFIVIQWCLSM